MNKALKKIIETDYNLTGNSEKAVSSEVEKSTGYCHNKI